MVFRHPWAFTHDSNDADRNVNEITAPQYIKAGAIAVGVGKALASEEEILAHDWAAIEQHAKQYVELLSQC
jgi:2-keto-3-deoxy-6-phosphogluconate aldolase